MKFAFAGTPQFGGWVLRDLLDQGLRPALVVSQPDRPTGRGRRTTPPPVVATAVSLGLDVVQTPDINGPEAVASLRGADVDVLVVAAFGQLLKAPLLEDLLCVNVHASALPSYRGAAPVARAIMAGEPETGVSIMRMSPGLDEGPVAAMTHLSIGPADTTGQVSRALALLGAQGIAQAFTALEDGTLVWHEQQGAPTYAAKLTVADRGFDPALEARRLHDRIRALAPDIGCDAATTGGLRLKVWRTWPAEVSGTDEDRAAVAGTMSGRTGACHAVGDRLLVVCGEGALEILAVQPAGKRVMHTREFLRGYRDRLGGYIGPRQTADKEG